VDPKRYTRLKLRILFFVMAGAVTATGLCLLLVWLTVNTPFDVPLIKLYHLIARFLFGRTAEEANAFLADAVIPNFWTLCGGALVVFLLLFFFIAMGWFTKQFNKISEQVHRMAEDTGAEVCLPEVLAPVEDDLNDIRKRLAQREREALLSARRSRDLVAFLAHDLKTPMTSVIGYLNLLHDQPDLPAEQRTKYTGIALDKARRLEELISEFFDINRMELERRGQAMETVSLTMLLQQLSEEFWPLFEEKNLTFHPAIADGLTVRGDPDKLARVFDNVLKNAVNYSVNGGAVGLRAFRQGREIVISVSNEGLEIPQKELSNIFRKFYRLDAARSTRTGGAGLGLAIAKEIVENHGGTIRAESTGKRTTFTIILPARQPGKGEQV